MNVEICNLSLTYPSGKTALREINLSMGSPNLIGLLGPNGAGKSTLMKLLVAGLLPTEGKISVDGKPLIQQERLLKARLGYLPQSFGLFDELTVWQFLDYMAALKGIAGSKEAIAAAIQRTGSASEISFRKWPRTGWCFCPLTLLKMFSRCVISSL